MDLVKLEIIGGKDSYFPLFNPKDEVRFVVTIKWDGIPKKPIIGLTIKNEENVIV